MSWGGAAVALATLAALTLATIAVVAPRVSHFATGEPAGLALGVGSGLGPWRRHESGRHWCKTACGGGFQICVRDGAECCGALAGPSGAA